MSFLGFPKISAIYPTFCSARKANRVFRRRDLVARSPVRFQRFYRTGAKRHRLGRRRSKAESLRFVAEGGQQHRRAICAGLCHCRRNRRGDFSAGTGKYLQAEPASEPRHHCHGAPGIAPDLRACSPGRPSERRMTRSRDRRAGRWRRPNDQPRSRADQGRQWDRLRHRLHRSRPWSRRSMKAPTRNSRKLGTSPSGRSKRS